MPGVMSHLTLCALTAKVNNADYLFIMALVSGWAILGRTFCPQGSCVRSKKMDKCKDLSKSDKRQIVMDR